MGSNQEISIKNLS